MRHLLTLTSLLISVSALAESFPVASPDGNTIVTVGENDGQPVYSISYKGNGFISESPLGLVTNIGDYSTGLSLVGASDQTVVKDSYSLPNIKKSHVDYSANHREFTFAKDGKPVFDVIFEVSDNNVAFRYRILPQADCRCCIVERETTGFRMPDGTTTFLCPQSKPMTGFARTAPSYETGYTPDDTPGKNGYGFGYTFPCLFRNGDKGWTLISETGIAGDYCASHLAGNTDGSYTIAYPMPEEMNGFGSSSAAVSLPGLTPWRTVTVGETLAPVTETTVQFDVVRPLYQASKNYRYGKGTWSWIMKMDPSCNFDEQKRYIDFASQLGYRSVLVDALWDTNIGYDRIAELAAYAREKGVGLYLWYNSNGSWNDAPQGPRNVMNDIVARRRDMRWMQKIGVLGIKVDFFGGDKQDMMRLYHDILADANDFGLLVIFHGCTLPRGWERMYPNYAASEAVLASENLHFGQGACDAEAFNASIHPFIRNAVGSMDFGGSALNKYYTADGKEGGSVRRTSDVFALATSVLFQSPVQHFALAPNNLTDAPAWALDFLKDVPTTWDETRFIDGYPGRYAILARRHGDRWYIAGVNAENKPLKTTITIPDDMKGMPLVIYSDNEKLEGRVMPAKPDKKGNIKVMIPTNGGLDITSAPDPKFHIYLCFGQSNMEGATPYEDCDLVGVDPRFRMLSVVNMPSKDRLMGRWYTAVPPLVRENTGLCPADYFGRTMVENLPDDNRVGIINVAIGGCRIELFDPDSCTQYVAKQPDWMVGMNAQYDNNPYMRLVEMAREAQKSGVIRGILIHQGESNTGESTWPQKVKRIYDRLVADLALDPTQIPLVAGEVLPAEAGGLCASMNPIINTLPSVIPNCTVVSSKGCQGLSDGLHFTADSYREMGRRYAKAMLDMTAAK